MSMYNEERCGLCGRTQWDCQCCQECERRITDCICKEEPEEKDDSLFEHAKDLVRLQFSNINQLPL